MGHAIDWLRGRAEVILACDTCGHAIIGDPVTDPPHTPDADDPLGGWIVGTRFMHAICPDDDYQACVEDCA